MHIMVPAVVTNFSRNSSAYKRAFSDLSRMLEYDEISWNLLAAETGVLLVAMNRFRVELSVKMIQRRLCYMHASAYIATAASWSW